MTKPKSLKELRKGTVAHWLYYNVQQYDPAVRGERLAELCKKKKATKADRRLVDAHLADLDARRAAKKANPPARRRYYAADRTPDEEMWEMEDLKDRARGL